MNIGNITNVHDSYISQGWLCPRCGKINAPWMGQCNCSGKPMEITCGSAEKGILSPGYYTTVTPASYPILYSTSTTPVTGAHPNDYVTLSGEPSDEVKELLRKWRKDPATDHSIDKTEEK